MNIGEYLQSMPNGPADELCFMSVDEANEALRGPRGKFGGGAYYRRVAAYVTGPENCVLGSADDFFNFAMTYDNVGDTYTELAVCRRALELYPRDADLLSRAIDAAGHCGRFEEGLGLVARLDEIDEAHWSHHPFVSVVSFYQAYLRACAPDEVDDVLARAMEVARAFQRHLPTDERGYNLEAELHLFAGNVEAARRVLNKAIFERVPGADGTPGYLMAAQCCLTMLSEVLRDSTDYELVERVARVGIRSCARDQPAAKVGYFLYREALAMDGEICSSERERDGYGNTEKVREVLMTYRCAYDITTSESYLANIRSRYSILCHKSGVLDLPLEEPAEGEE